MSEYFGKILEEMEAEHEEIRFEELEAEIRLEEILFKKYKICEKCGKNKFSHPEIKFKKCSGCISVNYCSKECQKEHWKRHKEDCLIYQENGTQPNQF